MPERAAVLVLASREATGIAFAVGGIVVIALISVVFYYVGRGEDRERAAAAVARDGAAPASEANPPAADTAPDTEGARPSRLPATARRRRRG